MDVDANLVTTYRALRFEATDATKPPLTTVLI